MATTAFTATLHATQVCLSAYAAYLSYIAIRDLLHYEERAEKAAKYSYTAEERLWKSRETQAAGALAVLLSLTTSLYLLYNCSTPSQPSSPTAVVWSIANVVADLASRAYISNFWHAKAKIPGVRRYNEAIGASNALKRLLGWLSVVWGVGVVVGGLRGFG